LDEHQLLLIPGPTPVPPSVLLSGARPMVNHRGPEFAQLIRDCTEGLKRVFQTRHDVFILTGAGTGGLEAAVVNMLSPGDKVLAVSIGVFGDRFASIAEAFGADVEKMSFEMGQAADPQKIKQRLDADTEKEIKAVLVTQNETSTGVMNDLSVIGPIIHEHGALALVDGISSLLAMDCQMDNWGLDVVVATAQKAFMVPPGISFIAANSYAMAAMEQAKMPRVYWDLKRAKQYFEQGQTPWTPAMPQFWQLGDALKIIEQEGLQASFARHARMGRMARAGVQALGLKLFADPTHASSAVTAVWKPDDIKTADLRKLLHEKYGVVLAGGQGKVKDDIFRIGHLGYTREVDIIAALGALGLALVELGAEVDPGAGAAAAVNAVEG
jgi:aspartate aminotransferase-like enzyme